jgi:hypothetical protein
MKLPLKKTTLNNGVQRTGLVKTLRGWKDGVLGEGKEVFAPLHYSHVHCPIHLFPLAVPELYPL